jgi:hypothetical protein
MPGPIYFIDADNSKLKKVSDDPAMITLKNRLYAIANNASSEGFLIEIDPASGSVRDVVRGRSDVWQSSGSINVSGLATDGTGLFTTQSGQLLYVTLDGNVKSITWDTGIDTGRGDVKLTINGQRKQQMFG